MVMTDLVDRKVQDADDFIGVAEVKGLQAVVGEAKDNDEDTFQQLMGNAEKTLGDVCAMHIQRCLCRFII